MADGPYKRAAAAYVRKGWRAVPVDVKSSGWVVPGVTGYNGQDPSRDHYREYVQRYGDANIGIVMPPNVVAIDVDLDPETGKDGAETYEAIVLDGPEEFPNTWSNGHGDRGSVYRHWLYRVPDDVTPEQVASLGQGKAGIDVLRWMHRWSRVSPSVHAKTGETYEWLDPFNEPCKAPRPEDLPQLTSVQWEHLCAVVGTSTKARYAASDVDTDAWLEAHAGKADSEVKDAVSAHWGRREGSVGVERHGSHHGALVACLQVLAHLGEEEHPVGSAIEWLRQSFLDYRDDEFEFDRALGGAIEQAVAKTESGDRDGPKTLVDEDGEPLRINHPEPDDGLDPEDVVIRQRKRDDAYNCSINTEPVEFAREYLSRHFNHDGVSTLLFVAESFWRWSTTRHHWVKVTDRQVKQWIQADLRGAWEVSMTEDGNEVKPLRLKVKNVNEVLDALKSEINDEPETPVAGVPFEDGWLDVLTGELLPLSPARYHTWCVPAKYAEDTGVDRWMEFLTSLGWHEDTNEYRLLRQWFGYLLSGENKRQKMLLLHGPTRCGKGTILAIAYKLLGDGATGLRLASLGGEFGLQPLVGKSLAVVGDARFTAKIDKTVVEALLSVSGKDPQSVNIKNKAQVSTRLPTRVMIATNDRPIFTDSSNALALRFLILHSGVSFLGREDLDLEEKLSGELAGIVKWALDGYKDLLDAGHFTATEVGTRMSEDFVKDSAPVRHFVDEMCDLAGEDGVDLRAYKVVNDTLYTAYGMWCDRSRMTALNRVHFMREILTAYEGQIVDGKSGGQRLKYGLRLRVGQ